jgi:hypothetical protein
VPCAPWRRHGAAIVEPHRHAGAINPLDGAQHAILHTQFALVTQEHDAVLLGKQAHAAGGLDRHIGAQRAMIAQTIPGLRIQFIAFCIGMGENKPTGLGMGLPIGIPAFDQGIARRFAGA